MQFVDEVTVEVKAGDGGNGCVAFRRERFVPLGGPSGGDGGNGGDIVIVADTRLSTLMDLRYRRELRAQDGEDGRGKDQYGHAGAEQRVRVPVGTQIYDDETGVLIADLDAIHKEVVVAKGGRGGRGNMHFATPYDRAPRRADPGQPGEHKRLRLELKLLADVGIVGFPNVGKSTFIAAVSRARPKIADYPFTTLTPNLGVVSLGDERSFVVADIPGIIEGASQGVGLGLRFLKHVERTRVLLHILALDIDPSRSMVRDYEILIEELRKFDATLIERPTLVAINKLDLPEAQAVFEKTKQKLESKGCKVLGMSTATREGVDAVLTELERMLKAHPRDVAMQTEERHPKASDRPHGNETGFPPAREGD